MIQIIKYLIYGFISGLSEIIPVSSRGHQSVLMLMFGMSERDPLLDLVVHISILSCVFLVCRNDFCYITSSKKTTMQSGNIGYYDRRLLLGASILMIIGLSFFSIGSKYELSPLSLSLFLLINGVILLIPDYIRQSNKHAGLMGPFDSFLIGLSGFLSVFPGISRMATGASFAIMRGADKERALNWVLLLTVPAMAILILLDLIGLFTIGLPGITVWLFISYLFAAGAAFLGTYIGILLMRFLAYNTGFSLFSYYSFGAAFFTFILYLIAY